MKLFKNFLIIWLVGAIASLIPWFYVGLILGFPAYTIGALLLIIIFKKELQ